MKIKTLLTAVFFFGFATVAGLMPTPASAFSNCSEYSISIPPGSIGGAFNDGDPSNSITFTAQGLQAGETYTVEVRNHESVFGSQTWGLVDSYPQTSNGSADYVINRPSSFEQNGDLEYVNHAVFLTGPGIPNPGIPSPVNPPGCLLGTYKVNFSLQCGEVKISQLNSAGQTCYGGGNSCIEGNKDVTVSAQIIDSLGNPVPGINIIINVTNERGGDQLDQQGPTDASGILEKTFKKVAYGSHKVTIELDDNGTNKNLCSPSFNSTTACTPELCNPDPTTTINNGGGAGGVNTELAASPFKLCEQIDATQFPDQYTQCVTCVGGEGEENKDGVWTAIGCIKREPQQIVVALTRLGLMVGGGIALLIMLASSFSLSVSQGDPKAKEEAKERITAAFVGLVFILFSVVIFQFMGVKVLQIPGIG